MFHSARLTLTLWYLLIIMVITGLFSIAIYANVNQEFNRIERFEKLRQEDEKNNQNSFNQFRNSQRNLFSQGFRPPRHFDPQMIQQSRTRLLAMLAIVDSVIFLLSGLAGYFLAGRTLKPIKDMVDEQNRFVTDASHELRTPLTALKSSIEVNLRDKKLTTAQAREILESNLEEVNNLQILSDSLIQLTQYPKNSKKQFVKLLLGEVIAEAIKKVTILAKAKNISISYASGNEVIYGEKQSLVELFIIILDNAIKYSFEKTKITISFKKIDGKVRIVITDQGMGIDKNDIPHIFDRFYRSDKSRTKSDTPGYGLGLSIAQQIVTFHNGSIHVESTIEKGTTFVVLLPRREKV